MQTGPDAGHVGVATTRPPEGWASRWKSGHAVGQVGLLGVLAYLAPAAAGTLRHWWWYLSGSTPRALRNDFTLYWIFAHVGLDHGWDKLYDPAAQTAVYAVVGHHLQVFPLPYTPPMAWLVVPFATFDPHTGYVLWSAMVAACVLVAWWLTTPHGLLVRLVLLAAMLGPYCVLLGLVNGQVIAVQVAAVAVAYWLLQRDRELAAGLVLVLLALRPQVLILVPVVLLLVGKRKAFVTWMAGTSVLVLASLATLGATGTTAYLARLKLTQTNPGLFWVSWYLSPWWVLRRHGYGWLAVPVTLVVLVAVAVVAWRFRHGGLEVPIAAATIGSLLTTPFLHLQDLSLLFLAAWLLLRARPAGWPVQLVIIIGCWALARALTPGFGLGLAYSMLALELVWLASLVTLRPGLPPTSDGLTTAWEVGRPRQERPAAAMRRRHRVGVEAKEQE